MRKHGGRTSQRDKYVMLAAIGPPVVSRGRFVGGHQSGLAGCNSPLLIKLGASPCLSQLQRQRKPWGASQRPSAHTYLPTSSLSDDPQRFGCGRMNRRAAAGHSRKPGIFVYFALLLGLREALCGLP